MVLEKSNKLNQLFRLDSAKGGLLFSSWLKRQGYSDQLLKSYRDRGWLSVLAKGVMYRIGAKVSAFGAVASYNEQMDKHFHVGALSALELWGFNHYVPMGKPVLTLGHPKEESVPDWMRLPEFDMQMKFFSTEIFPEQLLADVERNDARLKVSVPEQAFFECLLLAPMHYSYMDLYYVMEQLVSLRPALLQRLLESTDNVRVKRFFLYMAEKAGHTWLTELDRERISIGSGKRQFARNGIYIPEFMMTIPKELHEYE